MRLDKFISCVFEIDQRCISTASPSVWAPLSSAMSSHLLETLPTFSAYLMSSTVRKSSSKQAHFYQVYLHLQQYSVISTSFRSIYLQMHCRILRISRNFPIHWLFNHIRRIRRSYQSFSFNSNSLSPSPWPRCRS